MTSARPHGMAKITLAKLCHGITLDSTESVLQFWP